MRLILITNDDGIDSDGLIRLARTAAAFGQVWLVAPAHQRSAASHSITLDRPIDVHPHPFPDCPLEQCRGILTGRTVSGETFYRDHYEHIASLPGGGRRLMVKGIRQTETKEVGTDFRAILDGYVSVGTVRNLY